MAKSSSQKFIARNRAPRVQIEYDVELYGSEKKVQLPFVMGVLADLSGKPKEPLPPLEDRKMLEIDVDTFDERMRSMSPRAAFSIPNTLSGDGNLKVDLTFERLSDFSPAAVASKIEPLAKLLAARRELATLMAYMDGKSGAEDLILQLMENPAWLKALAATQTESEPEALAALEAEVAAEKGDAAAPPAATSPVESPTEVPAPPVPAPVAAQAEDTAVPEPAAGGSDELDALLADELTDTPSVEEVALGGPEEPASSPAAALADEAEASPIADAASTAAEDLAVEASPEDLPADLDGENLEAPAEEPVSEVTSSEAAGESPAMAVAAESPADNLDSLLDDGAPDEPSVEDVALGGPEEPGSDLTAALADEAEVSPIADATSESAEDLAVEALTEDLSADLDTESLDALTEEPDSEVTSSEAAVESLEMAEAAESPADDLDSLLDDGAPDEPSVEEVALGGPEEPGSDLTAALADEAEVPPMADAVSEGVKEFALEDLAEDLITENSAASETAVESPLPEEAAEPSEDELDALLGDGPPDEPFVEEIALEEGLDAGEEADAARAGEATVAEPAEEDLESLLEVVPVEEEGGELDSLITEGPADEETAADEPVEAASDDDLEDLLTEDAAEDLNDLESLLAEEGDEETAADAPAELAGGSDVGGEDLESLLEEPPSEESPDDLESLLADESDDETQDSEDTEGDDLESLLGESASDEAQDDLESLLEETAGDTEGDDLESLLDTTPEVEAEAAAIDDTAGDDDLAALLAEDSADDPTSGADDDLAALLAEDSPDVSTSGADDDLEALLAEGSDQTLEDDLSSLLEEEGPAVNPATEDLELASNSSASANETAAAEGSTAASVPAVRPYAPDFGRFEGPQPDLRREANSPFRIALLGDFSGRANKGLLEKGDELAKRKGIRVEYDNLDEVIQRFGITLNLPIGAEGGAVKVPINSIDDFHPDDLCDNLEIFDELKGLRQRLQSSAGFESAAAEVQGWAQEGLALPKPEAARGAVLPATSKLEDFARLLGRPAVVDRAESTLVPMLRQMVAPHLVPDKDPRQDELVARVDEALSGTLRSVLHHPDFQTMEALWRSVDFLVRRIETSHQLQVVLYDISAEELAADLSAVEDLSQSGLYRLLVEQPCMDENQGALSAIIAHYSFEMTPPHAELLARMGHIAAAGKAPFVAALSSDCLKLDFDELHPLIKSTWQALKAMPEAAYLGLALPRFLLRHPYGRKTEPIDPFDFEEFTLKMGLKAMLWANPVTAVATILGMSYAQNGDKMDLGSILSLGEMPFYYYEDPDGDQMALPCTERLINERAAMALTAQRLMPILSIQGRPEIRLGSVNSLAGVPLAGLWSDPATLPAAPPPTPDRVSATLTAGDLGGGDLGGEGQAAAELPSAEVPDTAAAEGSEEPADLSDLDLELDDLPSDAGDADLDDLDALLGSLDLDEGSGDGSGNDEEMDPELAALLADL